MKPLSSFGDKNNPIRSSSLDYLVKCPVRSVLLFTGTIDNTSGEAADTGSITHAGVAAFHRQTGVHEKRTEAGLAAMSASLSDFPLGDHRTAQLIFRHYIADPRNQQADCVMIEEAVKFTFPDSDGNPIYITGTLDQVRRAPDGTLRVYDLKTGGMSESRPTVYALSYVLQFSAYMIGATDLLKQPVNGARMIFTSGYRRKNAPPASQSPDGVFFTLPLDLQAARCHMDRVASTVAAIRRGDVQFGANMGLCGHCNTGGPDLCVPLAAKTLGFSLDVI